MKWATTIAGSLPFQYGSLFLMFVMSIVLRDICMPFVSLCTEASLWVIKEMLFTLCFSTSCLVLNPYFSIVELYEQASLHRLDNIIQ